MVKEKELRLGVNYEEYNLSDENIGLVTVSLLQLGKIKRHSINFLKMMEVNPGSKNVIKLY